MTFLAVDCGRSTTKAAARDGHQITLVRLGSAAAIPSTVALDPHSGQLTVTPAAASTDRSLLQRSPIARIGDEPYEVGEFTVDPVDLVAALLAHVHTAAAAGGVDSHLAVTEVAVVVPAGWGPHRRTLLRRAARRAGYPDPRLVEAPIAILQRAHATGQLNVAEGSAVLVCDLGAGCEASVVTRTNHGWDTVATFADDDAAGDAIDRAFIAALRERIGSARDTDVPTVDDTHVSSAKEALGTTATVLVPTNLGAPLVVDTSMLQQAAAPAYTAAVKAVQQVATRADITLADLAAVIVAGGSAQLVDTGPVLATAFGRAVIVVNEPQHAAVLGAVGTPDPADAPLAARDPVPWSVRMWDNLGAIFAGFSSLALLLLFLFTTDRYNGDALTHPDPFLVANWGVLAMASALAVVTALAVAVNGVASLYPTNTALYRRLLVAALIGGAAAGTAVAASYAIIISAYFTVPAGPILPTTLWSSIPIGITAIAVGVLTMARTQPATPSTQRLRFPDLPVLVATAGMALAQTSFTIRTTTWLASGATGHLGGTLLGVGIGLLITRKPLRRLAAATVLGLGFGLIMAFPTATLLGAGFVIAVTVWWAIRAAQLILAHLTNPGSHPAPIPRQPDRTTPRASGFTDQTRPARPIGAAATEENATPPAVTPSEP
jgi:hypothetical protein